MMLLHFVFFSHKDSGLGHLICFEEFDIIKHDLSRGLKYSFTLGFSSFWNTAVAI